MAGILSVQLVTSNRYSVILFLQVLSEFAAACRSTAVAITEGLIAPLTMGDPNQSEIYVYNGIFFSKAEDTKDSFKLCVGDDAYRKCTARELQNQRLIRALEVEGVGLILSAIIDYKGERIIGQSIIPGIFAQVSRCVACPELAPVV